MLTRTCARACACADTETYCELVANHVAGLRASAPGCSILFGIETVSTFTSITLERFLKRDERASANMYFVREDRTKGGAPDIGIYTSAAIKESAVHLINLFLRKQMVFDADIVYPRARPPAFASENDERAWHHKFRSRQMDTLRRQLMSYSEIETLRGGRRGFTLSGKHRGADDLVSALQLAVMSLWYTYNRNSPVYVRLRE